ncbi:vanillyl-alcohol oxidase [Lasiosphaeria hispida]|uniref:Vanillyl-alcohol oxidase n=1 Tax=Lasiosphaeria hispida TaxID=260671 RepID=A0AAJ0MHU1_9PEZI|nr:vanillyl-alcohol oxidase [Lasiosphaeria hispida]
MAEHMQPAVKLPPNFTAEAFTSFLTRAKELGGAENVTATSPTAELLVDDQSTDPCKTHDMHAVYNRDFFVSSAVVAPRNVPEVQDNVRLANELVVPIWPFSAGRNTGYGGTAPRVPGSVAIDLGVHMNKILEVNVEGAFALVEPGVTYMSLYEHLEKTGLTKELWIDISNINGCVSFEPAWGQCRTRKHHPVLPPNKCWQLFNYGFGPYNDGIFSQSNLGIVVKMGTWDDDPAAIVDIVRPLRLQKVLQNVPTLRHILLDAAVGGPKSSYTSDNKTPLSEEETDRIAKDLDLGRWNFYGAVYQRLRARWLIRTLVRDCAAHGWGEYRTHLALMDQIANTYFNALMRLNETIKNALDPNGILAPGKNGVWPSSYCKEIWVLGEDWKPDEAGA